MWVWWKLEVYDRSDIWLEWETFVEKPLVKSEFWRWNIWWVDNKKFGESHVYWTVHHLDSWIKRDQLDTTYFIISLFNAQHFSDVNTSETCWALNNEIIKQVTSSWSLFIQEIWCFGGKIRVKVGNDTELIKKMSAGRQICGSLWWTNGVFLERSCQLLRMAVNEIWVWRIFGMILTRKYWSTWRKTSPSALIFHQKSHITWPVIEAGPPQW